MSTWSGVLFLTLAQAQEKHVWNPSQHFDCFLPRDLPVVWSTISFFQFLRGFPSPDYSRFYSSLPSSPLSLLFFPTVLPTPASPYLWWGLQLFSEAVSALLCFHDGGWREWPELYAAAEMRVNHGCSRWHSSVRCSCARPSLTLVKCCWLSGPCWLAPELSWSSLSAPRSPACWGHLRAHLF